MFDAIATEVVITTLEAFMPDTDNVLIVSKIMEMEYRLASIAMSTMFQAATRAKTLRDLIESLFVRIMFSILQNKCMSGVVTVFLVIHKTINTKSEIITNGTHYICNHIRYCKHSRRKEDTLKTIVTNATGIIWNVVLRYRSNWLRLKKIHSHRKFILLNAFQSTTQAVIMLFLVELNLFKLLVHRAHFVL